MQKWSILFFNCIVNFNFYIVFAQHFYYILNNCCFLYESQKKKSLLIYKYALKIKKVSTKLFSPAILFNVLIIIYRINLLFIYILIFFKKILYIYFSSSYVCFIFLIAQYILINILQYYIFIIFVYFLNLFNKKFVFTLYIILLKSF